MCYNFNFKIQNLVVVTYDTLKFLQVVNCKPPAHGDNESRGMVKINLNMQFLVHIVLYGQIEFNSLSFLLRWHCWLHKWLCGWLANWLELLANDLINDLFESNRYCSRVFWKKWNQDLHRDIFIKVVFINGFGNDCHVLYFGGMMMAPNCWHRYKCFFDRGKIELKFSSIQRVDQEGIGLSLQIY